MDEVVLLILILDSTYNAPPIPTPPATTNAPEVVLMDEVVLVMFKFTKLAVLAYTLSDVIVPPTVKSLRIPTPPATVNAPVVVEVDATVPDNVNTPAVLNDMKVFPPCGVSRSLSVLLVVKPMAPLEYKNWPPLNVAIPIPPVARLLPDACINTLDVGEPPSANTLPNCVRYTLPNPLPPASMLVPVIALAVRLLLM